MHKPTTICVLLLLCFFTYLYPVFQWFFSGVVSSVGLGTGANTGLLFLMPYTAGVAKAHDTFWTPYLQTLPATTLHAVGSAFGELPPYFLADTLVHQLPGKQYIQWMTQYMRVYGWWMIFLFACWPSMFFDMCGLCAGILKIPTATFLTATVAGKVVKSYVLSASLVMAVQRGKDVLPEIPHAGALPWIGYGLTGYAVVATWRKYKINKDVDASRPIRIE